MSKWHARPGGIKGDPSDPRQTAPFTFTDYPVAWGLTELLSNPEPSAQIIGSFTLDGYYDKKTGIMHWQATNQMDLESFFGGSLTKPFHMPDVDEPLPYGSMKQIIRWDTTPTGQYIPPKPPHD